MAALACSPRVRVAALVPTDDGILLVRHAKDGRTYHLLPGGGVEAGETVGDALVREVLEETGLTCRPLAPLFINDSIDPDGSRHVIQLTFLAQVTGEPTQAPTPDARIAGTEVVAVTALRTLDLRPPMAAAIESAATEGFAGPARYLGALWATDPSGVTGADGSPAQTG